MELQDYFSKIFIINLPERTDRREEIIAMFKKRGINSDRFEFFPAIRPQETGGFRTIGARGCFLSHLAILEKAQKEQLPSILIMEDDLDIECNFADIENQLIQEMHSENWDIVYLGHPLKLPKSNANFFTTYNDTITLTHFLGFKQNTVKQLVPFLHGLLKEPPGSPKGGPMDVDGAYSTFRLRHPEIITLVANPSLGGQRSSRGDVTIDKWFDRPGILRFISAKLRKLKLFFKTNKF